MSKVELALKLNKVALEFLEEAHKAEQERADLPFDPSLKKLLEEARAELDRTSGALVTMRNQWLAEVKRREVAEATVTSQQESLQRQNAELNRTHDALTAANRRAEEMHTKLTKARDENSELRARLKDAQDRPYQNQ